MEFYTGSQHGDTNNGAGYSVVSRLLDGYEGVGHVLACDNFFTSATLFYDLREKLIYATGTCRTDRVGWPQALMQKDNGVRGTLLHCMHVSGKLAAMSWCDRKVVNLLSIAASPLAHDGSCFVDRWVKGQRREVPTSPILKQYQKFMKEGSM